MILLREFGRRLKLTESVNRRIFDPRRSAACEHSQLALLNQRIYALALGNEDLNDHADLRLDGAVQTAVDSDKPLASTSTLCRLENRIGPGAAAALYGVLVDQVIASFKAPRRKPLLLAWCDRHRADYIVGIGKKPALAARSEVLAALSRAYFELYECGQQHFDDFDYHARSWAMSGG